MIRAVGYLLLGLGLVCVTAVLAQDLGQGKKPTGGEPELKPLAPPGGDPNDLKPPKNLDGGLKKKKQGKKPVDLPIEEENPNAGKAPKGSGTQEDPKKILARIAKNLEDVEGRLKKHDTGDNTRDLQKKILEDLDKLLQQEADKQKKKGGGGGGGPKKSQKQQSKKGGGQGQGQKSPQQGGNNGPKKGKGQKGGKKGGGQGQAKQGGGNAKPGQAKPGGQKPGTKPGGQKGGNNGKAQLAQKKGPPNQKVAKGKGVGPDTGPINPGKSVNLADLDLGVWGHWPKRKRQEMDAYSRERFMPQYEQLLRQYYRTIAEQGRRRDGE